ncbi:MAG: hypothetical protein LWY06_13065 [Firmicutes bacterium]|nr:hypothetical protein [Bacillota bacterium]
MKKLFATLLLLGLSFIFSTPAFCDQLIVPGERIGPVFIGMRDDDMIRALGKPDQSPVTTAEGLQEFQFIRNHLLIVDVDPKTHTVKNIATGHTTRYQTSTGIKVGATQEFVELRMGKASVKQMPGDSISLNYVSSGIEFVIREKDKQKKVFVIIVKEKH